MQAVIHGFIPGSSCLLVTDSEWGRTNEPVHTIIVTLAATLYDSIVKVRLQWVCVIMKDICQSVCQMSLVV